MTLVARDRALDAFAADVGAEGDVAIEGARTRWSLGGAVRDGVRALRAPAGILEHHPEEMTVRVRAGTTTGDLEAALSASGQRSALPARGGTVGGAISVGENHLDVLSRGTVRASVLQVRYVAADGRLVTGGGPTVKNVSGFDLPRLMVGSLGTLGLLAEMILRTNPAPPLSIWLTSEDADPFDTLRHLRRRSTVLWDGARSCIHLEGHPRDLEAQRRALAGTWAEAATGPTLPSHRWSLRPSDLRTIPRADTGPFVASIGVGTVFASEPQPPRPLDETAQRLGRRAKLMFDPTGRLNPGRNPSER